MAFSVRATGCIGLAVTAITGAPAFAQQTPPEDTVIITSTRREASAQSLPVSVAVLGEREIGEIDSLDSIADRVAGLQVAISNGSQATFQIRGLGAVDHQALTPSAAAVHVDGVFLATNVQASALAYDLKRIEVLKGPQGAIQGRNAASGSVNVFTATPTDTTEGYLKASAGLYAHKSLEGALSGPLADGVTGRIAGRMLFEGPALKNVGGPANAGGRSKQLGLRGALDFDLAGDSQLLLRAHAEIDKGINPAPRNSSVVVQDHELSIGADGVQPTDNSFSGASAEYATTLGSWTIKSLTAVEAFRQRYGFDFDGMPTPLANLSYDRDFQQISQEITGATRWSGGSLIVGVSLATEDFAQDYLIWCGTLNTSTLAGTCAYPGAAGRVGPQPASTAPAVSLLTHIDQQRDMGALFASLDLALDADTTLTVGGRQTVERIEGAGYGEHIYADGIRALNNRSGVGLARGENAIDENHFTGMLALQRRIGDFGNVYASFGQGYKSGGFNGEVANNVTHYQDEGLFHAETVDAYEVGFKGDLFNRVSLEAAYFWQTIDAPQARIFVAFPLPGGGLITSNSLANLHEARVSGVDVSAVWRASDTLRITGGVVALDSEINQPASASGADNAATFDGKPLPFASDLSVTLGLQESWSLPNDARLGLDVFVKHQSAYFLDAEGRADRRQGPVTLLDSTLRWSPSDHLDFEIWGRNLLDEDYAVSGYGFVGYNTFRSQPAMWGVAIKAHL